MSVVLFMYDDDVFTPQGSNLSLVVSGEERLSEGSKVGPKFQGSFKVMFLIRLGLRG